MSNPPNSGTTGIRIVRAIDRWIGVPLALALGAIHRLGRLLRVGRSVGDKITSVCFLELSEAGAAIPAASAVLRLQSRYPDVTVHWVIFDRHRSSLAGIGVVPESNILTVSTRDPLAFALDTVRVLARLRRQQVDAVVDLELFSRYTSILSMLSGAPIRAGFDRNCHEGLFRGGHLSHPVAYNPYQHMALNFHALVDALAFRKPDRVPVVRTRLAAEEIALPHIRTPRRRGVEMAKCGFPEFDPGQHRLVLMCPHAGALPLRAWPVDNYKELARRFIQLGQDVRVAVIGPPEANAEADDIVLAVDNAACASLVGVSRSLAELVEVYNVARLLVTSDGGPAQFSSLSPMPAVVLFGPETPLLYAPLGTGKVCLWARLSCSPCFSAFNHRRSPCQRNDCMQAITVDEVWNASLRLLADARNKA